MKPRSSKPFRSTTRADGLPSGVEVARVMAFGSKRFAASASPNHRRNCSVGSGWASASLRPARVYSLRSLFRSLREAKALPTRGAGAALKGAYDLGGDPAAVEAPLLRPDSLPVDPAGVHERGVEGHVVFKAREGGDRVRVGPGGPPFFSPVGLDVVVARRPLPLAKGRAPGGLEVLHPDVLGRDVVDRRVARLQNALGARRVGERDPAKDHLDAPLRVLELWRARVVPDGFLPRTWLYALTTPLTHL